MGRHPHVPLIPVPAVEGRIAELIAPLREAAAASAVLCDIDGTLAPIVDDPRDVVVPEETREALRALAWRYALVACVSGRRAVEARSLVGVEELTYAGNHGLEVLTPGAEEASIDPAIADRARVARDFVFNLASANAAAGLRLEDKGPIQALHWRAAADERAAEQRALEVAEEARRAGLEPRWGRKVLELRPAAEVDKGSAVRRLLAGRPVELALFGGDDRTDLDAFDALREMTSDGRLRAAVCIGIGSDEAPPELSERVDVVVRGPSEFLGVLRALAEPWAGAADAARA